MVKINRYLAHANKSQTNIIFSICEKGNRLKFTSKVSIETKYWDSSKQRVKPSYVNSIHINKTLSQLQQFIESECLQHYDNYNAVNFDELKDSIKNYQDKGKRNKLTLVDFIDEFIDYKKSSASIKYGTIKGYNGFKKNVIDFEKLTKKTIYVADIDQKMIIDFKNFLSKEIDYSDNTISYKMSLKNVILNYAFKKKYIDNQDYKDVTTKTHQTESISLTDEDVDKLFNYKTLNKKLNKAKYFFLFQIYSGLRVSDIAKLTKEKIDLDNETVKIVTEKTNKVVTIPISKHLRDIIEAYDITTFKTSWYPTYSLSLKQLCKNAGINDIIVVTKFKNNMQVVENKPKYELISSHTARRTFVTRLIKEGVSATEIMQITGHTTRESFDKYIRIANTEAVSNIKDKLNAM